MVYTPVKCPNCNSNLPVAKDGERVVCEYCGTAYVRNVAQKNASKNAQPPPAQNSTVRTPPPVPPDPFNYTPPVNNQPRKLPPRPRLNCFITVLLLFMYFVPGIIYIVHILHRQKEWDEKYGRS